MLEKPRRDTVGLSSSGQALGGLKFMLLGVGFRYHGTVGHGGGGNRGVRLGDEEEGEAHIVDRTLRPASTSRHAETQNILIIAHTITITLNKIFTVQVFSLGIRDEGRP